MNIRYYRRAFCGDHLHQAIKLHTVNVLEFENGGLQQVCSFTDNPAGNKRAEKLFTRLMVSAASKCGEKVDKQDISDALDNGIFEVQSLGAVSYMADVYITHSV